MSFCVIDQRHDSFLKWYGHIMTYDWSCWGDQNTKNVILSRTGVFHNGNAELKPTNYQPISTLWMVLQALRKAQESEYKIAEERFYGQKNYLRNLYQQLDKERSELSHQASGTEANALLNAILNRVDQIKQEVMKLKEMEVAHGFGKTPKGTLKEHYGLELED
ncbi:hypothetical protein REPUB_Repub20aG0084100 [Reevesia pubescens]